MDGNNTDGTADGTTGGNARGAGGGDAGGPGRAGRVLAGRYRLLEPVGRGGTGVVWRARDEVLARDVAVREVRAPAGADPAELLRTHRRLEREAWAAARISHRGVVTVYDVASEAGRPWIVMELVRGLSLAEVLEAEGPMPPQRAAHLGEQVLAALRSAHESGVLHRDVRPSNVLIANDGRVLLGDFGIADPPGSAFLAPEQVAGGEPGPASDLWSLGALLYAAVEGAPPRAAPSEAPRADAGARVPAPRRAGPLEPVLEGLLRRDPAERTGPAEAARMLRLVGAGGAVRASGGPVSEPGGPAPAARPGQEPPGGGGGAAHGPAREDGDDGGAEGARAQGVRDPAREDRPSSDAPREGRAGLLLAAGVAVLLLALVALGWLLLAG
ncbi:hypothetical protein GCM10010371_52070 [Streptomyces subrutilus]|uniref:non-specific serine/threonine protein kinase n=1 Tax=Streptomyces subrutilus TaxID=36818 RepID=A0A918VAP6_9ACTN|nr:hypothetical protein GCM10010371_52070 [Streptomyces subrutilus]